MKVPPLNRSRTRVELAAFAAAVLAMLEDDEDWNADTLDCIVAEASRRGMADPAAGTFKVAQPFRRWTHPD